MIQPYLTIVDTPDRGRGVFTSTMAVGVTVAMTALYGRGVDVPARAAAAVEATICAAAVSTFSGIGVGSTTIGVTTLGAIGVNVPVVTATAVA